MTITDIQVYKPKTRDDRVLAYCTIVLDGLIAVHDLKIIRGNTRIFLAMPSRKATLTCTACSRRHDFDAQWCPHCGYELPEPPELDKAHFDICHPITKDFRDTIERMVLDAYKKGIYILDSSRG